jgi:response regulator RpfG family c-di-GMP phosphodiesterase
MTINNLLLIDDDSVEHALLDHIQHRYHDYQSVIHARGIEQALEILVHIKPSQLPDVVIINPHMQSNAGWRLARQLKIFYRRFHRRVQICFLSNWINPREVTKAAANHSITSMLYKPLSYENLQNFQQLNSL